MNHFELVLTEEHPSAQVYIHYFRSCYCLYDHFEGTKGLYVQVFYGRNQSETWRDELILKLIVGGSELMACDDANNGRGNCASASYITDCLRNWPLIGLISVWISLGRSIQTSLSDNAHLVQYRYRY